MKKLLRNPLLQGLSFAGILAAAMANPASAQLTGSVFTGADSDVDTGGFVFGFSDGESSGSAFSGAGYIDFEATTQIGGQTSAESVSVFFGNAGQFAVTSNDAVAGSEILGVPIQLSGLSANSFTAVETGALGLAGASADGSSQYGAILSTDGTLVIESVNVTSVEAGSSGNGASFGSATSGTLIEGALFDLTGF